MPSREAARLRKDIVLIWGYARPVQRSTAVARLPPTQSTTVGARMQKVCGTSDFGELGGDTTSRLSRPVVELFHCGRCDARRVCSVLGRRCNGARWPDSLRSLPCWLEPQWRETCGVSDRPRAGHRQVRMSRKGRMEARRDRSRRRGDERRWTMCLESKSTHRGDRCRRCAPLKASEVVSHHGWRVLHRWRWGEVRKRNGCLMRSGQVARDR